LDIAHTIVSTLEEKKGENIQLLDIHEIASFADYFVICSGTSDRMLGSLAAAVDESVKKTYGINCRTEGHTSTGWVLVDVGDVVVHLFYADVRDYYQLEQLWEEGKVLLRLP
jgi:ribosome-associated protein